jgi:hypothetical protein
MAPPFHYGYSFLGIHKFQSGSSTLIKTLVMATKTSILETIILTGCWSQPPIQFQGMRNCIFGVGINYNEKTITNVCYIVMKD